MKNTVKALSLLSLTLILGACGQNPATPAEQSFDASVSAPVVASAPLPNRWLVELEGDPTALSAQSVGSQQADFRAQAVAQDIQYEEVYSYHTLFNGFSIKTSDTDIQRISRMPGVKNVYPVQFIPMPEVKVEPEALLNATLQPDMFYAKNMTGVNIAQNELGLTGKGVRVGVIDTGLDLGHPAFRGRVVSAVDLVGDSYGSNGNYTPKPGPSPQDCAGHGTHVAGIVGGYDPGNTREGVPFSGVAPDVSFGIYRVFGCAGGTNDDVMIAAMERAYADGMQVVNLSIGSPFSNWAHTPDAVVGSRMIKKGMIVVASAGNSGASGNYSMGGVTMGENVISVASIDNARIELSSLLLSDGSKVGFYSGGGAPAPVTGSKFSVTKKPGSTTTTVNDGCTASGGFAPGSLTGKAVLIRRGTCTFYEKAKNAQDAGASAVILYNNTAGYISPSVAGTPAITIPVVAVSDKDGAKIDSLIASGVSITFDGGSVAIANPTSDTLSSFSSYGMSAELELKPDVSAPGGNIISAYPRSLTSSGYSVLSGTSMASPHVAGVAALVLQANPNMQAKEMRTLLMNTATLRWYRAASGTLYRGLPDYVQRQGAGMVDVVGAYNNKVRATPSKLSLGDSGTFATRNKVVVLKNTSAQPMTYQAYNYPALTVAGTTLAPVPDESSATMTINGQSADTDAGVKVTVPAGGEVELNIVITPPAGAPDKSEYGGYVDLEASDGSTLVVPYSGFKGDYQTVQTFGDIVLNGVSRAAPFLYDAVPGQVYFRGGNINPLPDYTFKTVRSASGSIVQDNPVIWANLAHQVRKVTFEVLNEQGVVVATPSVDEFLGRNCTNDLSKTSDTCSAYERWTWDGKLSNGTDASAGVYRLRLTALKPLGDVSNPKSTEVYTSPQFKVVR